MFQDFAQLMWEAALTGWYETYYEVVKDGQFFRVINDMHSRYGITTSILTLQSQG
jgi:hypothetical protein